MTSERIEELRKHADRFNVQLLHEALDEVERLRKTGHEACNWLESTSDKAARRDAAAIFRAEIEMKP